MKSPPALPCLFLPAWCPAQLTPDLQVGCADGHAGANPSLGEALQRFGSRPVALILPVEQVACCAVALPAGSAHWQRQALPYAVEPLLAEEVEALHLVMGARRADGHHPVRAVNRSLLQGWLHYLRGQGMRIAAIHVDADLLPTGAAVLWWDVCRCLLAGMDETRLALAPAQLGLAGALPDSLLQVFHGSDVTPHMPLACDFTSEVVNQPVLVWLAAQRGQALDLAQGTFAARPPVRLRHWQPLVAALALLACAQLAFDGAQAWLLNQQAAGYRQANEAIYKGLFPQEQRIVDLRAQFDQHLQQGSAASHLQTLLDAVATAMPGDGQLQVQQLQFDAASARLQIQLQGGDSNMRQAVLQHLQAAGLQVQAQPSTGEMLQLSVGGAQ